MLPQEMVGKFWQTSTCIVGTALYDIYLSEYFDPRTELFHRKVTQASADGLGNQRLHKRLIV